MSKVSRKLQVTIPKAVADAYHIGAGSLICFEPAGEVIRLRIDKPNTLPTGDVVQLCISLFDAATARQAQRNERYAAAHHKQDQKRGWQREDLYDRGLSG